MPDDPPQTRHQPFQPIDLLAADVDLFLVELGVLLVATEDRAKEVDRVADLVGDLGGDGLHQRDAFGLPGGGLLFAPLLQLRVAESVRQGQRRLVGDGAQQIDVGGGEEGAPALAADHQPPELLSAEGRGDRAIARGIDGRRQRRLPHRSELHALARQPATHGALDRQRDLPRIGDRRQLLAELLDGRFVLRDGREEAALDGARGEVHQWRRDQSARGGSHQRAGEGHPHRGRKGRPDADRQHARRGRRHAAREHTRQQRAAVPQVVPHESDSGGHGRQRERRDGQEGGGRAARAQHRHEDAARRPASTAWRWPGRALAASRGASRVARARRIPSTTTKAIIAPPKRSVQPPTRAVTGVPSVSRATRAPASVQPARSSIQRSTGWRAMAGTSSGMRSASWTSANGPQANAAWKRGTMRAGGVRVEEGQKVERRQEGELGEGARQGAAGGAGESDDGGQRIQAAVEDHGPAVEPPASRAEPVQAQREVAMSLGGLHLDSHGCLPAALRVLHGAIPGSRRVVAVLRPDRHAVDRHAADPENAGPARCRSRWASRCSTPRRPM